LGGFGRRTWAALLASLTLAACEVQAPVPVAPPARPQPAPATAYTSPLSRELADYYARVERDLVAQGLLRTDGGGPDTPFTQRQLVEDFIRIALYEEFSNVGGFMVARQTRSRLHRWEKPVRIGIEFGASVPDAQRRADRAEIAAYARRLARVTGHPISVVSQGANFHVLVVSEDERRRLGPHLKELAPSLSPAAIRAIEDLPRSTFCLVFAVDPDGTGTYDRAVAIIRAEHPPLLRRSCIHEEIAQGLGLSNDSPDARPSIFNDDEEFALLTTHDELLLRMLYDPRMRPGMTPEEARPVAEIIAAELMGGPA
jgi:hypothetical protein